MYDAIWINSKSQIFPQVYNGKEAIIDSPDAKWMVIFKINYSGSKRKLRNDGCCTTAIFTVVVK